MELTELIFVSSSTVWVWWYIGARSFLFDKSMVHRCAWKVRLRVDLSFHCSGQGVHSVKSTELLVYISWKKVLFKVPTKLNIFFLYIMSILRRIFDRLSPKSMYAENDSFKNQKHKPILYFLFHLVNLNTKNNVWIKMILITKKRVPIYVNVYFKY